MCGRFALGLSGGELEEALARDYFQPPQQHQGAQDQEADDQQTEEDADEQVQVGGAAENGQGQAPRDEVGKSTRQDALHWSSFEAQSTFRPRYNVRVRLRTRSCPDEADQCFPSARQVAPTTQIPVVRRTKKDQEAYELDLMKWGLVPRCATIPPSRTSLKS